MSTGIPFSLASGADNSEEEGLPALLGHSDDEADILDEGTASKEGPKEGPKDTSPGKLTVPELFKPTFGMTSQKGDSETAAAGAGGAESEGMDKPTSGGLERLDSVPPFYIPEDDASGEGWMTPPVSPSQPCPALPSTSCRTCAADKAAKEQTFLPANFPAYLAVVSLHGGIGRAVRLLAVLLHLWGPMRWRGQRCCGRQHIPHGCLRMSSAWDWLSRPSIELAICV